MDVSPTDPAVAERARKRIAWRLLPFLLLLYIIAFLDRMNVSAAALQMPGDLGFNDKVVRPRSRHVFHRLPGAGNPRRIDCRALERAPVDRSHHDFLGNHNRADGLYPHGPGILYGPLSCWCRRSGLLPCRHRLLVALVPISRPRQSRRHLLRGQSAFLMSLARLSPDCCWESPGSV